MTQQFDDLGQAYDDSLGLPFRRHMEAPSLMSVLGDLTGKSILDVGCGSGAYARLFTRSGAGRVVGIDASPGMIATAEQQERDHPLGIEFACMDVADARDLGPFDLAVGVYVLPYAATFDHLRAMCRGVAHALTPHGRFVTLPLNPDFAADPDWYRGYGFTLTDAGPRGEGTPVTLTVQQDSSPFAVTAYRWSRDAHETALRAAGFTELTWSRPQPTAAGLAAHGPAFWQPYLARPHALILDCRKAPSAR